MDNKMTDAIRNISPRKFFLTDGKTTIKGLTAKWWWLPSFLARMLVGFVFIRAGWNMWHGWDDVFPALELIFGALMVLGLFTRFTALLLLGGLAFSILNAKLRELTGLNLSALQNVAMIALLVGLCAAGGGSGSIDRCIFKRNAPNAD